MAFTARHYNEVARIIRTERERLLNNDEGLKALGGLETVHNIRQDLRRMFAADNPRFDGTRFDMACEPKESK